MKNQGLIYLNILRFRTDVHFFNDNSIKYTNIPKNIPT